MHHQQRTGITVQLEDSSYLASTLACAFPTQHMPRFELRTRRPTRPDEGSHKDAWSDMGNRQGNPNLIAINPMDVGIYGKHVAFVKITRNRLQCWKGNMENVWTCSITPEGVHGLVTCTTIYLLYNGHMGFMARVLFPRLNLHLAVDIHPTCGSFSSHFIPQRPVVIPPSVYNAMAKSHCFFYE